MRISALLSAATITLAATMGPVFAADQFATLEGVKAAPMSMGELAAVKGMHIHFTDGAGGSHIAGVTPITDNPAWFVGGDGNPIAPSYHGLCVAMGVGVGGISIGGGAVQCP